MLDIDRTHYQEGQFAMLFIPRLNRVDKWTLCSMHFYALKQAVPQNVTVIQMYGFHYPSNVDRREI